MKTKVLSIVNAIVFGSLLVLFTGCSDNGVTPPTNPLQLTVEDVTCTEVFLKLTLNASELNRSILLKRNDSLIATITMKGNDSLFVDENLLPKHTYRYTLATQSFSVTAQAITQDTTSHNVQWQLPDTLGAQGVIRDVWVFSKTDAWAVGEIYLADSTGKPNMERPYNAAHWNGSKWEIKQIPTAGFVGSGFYPIYAIFAFTPNDIWTFSESGSYSHWNGQTWTTAFVAERQGGGQKLWGTSSSNLYLVGTNGSISKCDGSNWTKMESHTTVDLQDIWGIDNSHIWATGYNSFDGHCAILKYDGKQWTTLYDSDTQPGETKYQFRTLWTDSPLRIYLDGGSWLRILNLSNYSISSQINTERTYVSYCARGIQKNNIFDIGQASEVAHFNGESWYLYSELKEINGGLAWFYSVHPTEDFILIGGVSLTALNGFPVVVRGYR